MASMGMYRVRQGRTLAGDFVAPGDKSITHRAYLFGAIAGGVTTIRDANDGEDCERSLAAAEMLGALVQREEHVLRIGGRDLRLRAPDAPIDCGNSGTSMRLLAGIVAGQPFATTLIGDESLSRRPMARILAPLRLMGADIAAREDRLPPLTIRGGVLAGIAYDSPVASAQVSTCILLAALTASGVTRVTLPGPARDHTERMLPLFGAELDVQSAALGGRSIQVQGGTRLRGTSLRIPGDLSAAAFLLAAAAAQPGAEVTALGVNTNPTRAGLLEVLAAMGASVSMAQTRIECGEPVADVTVRGPERLRAFDVPREWVPRLIDEAPAWIIAATAAEGTSRLTGASELRVKESDRIVALARNLAAVGATVRELPDGLEVTGGPVHGGHIQAHLDHRIVMAFAALGCRTRDAVTFDDVDSVATSFPSFFTTLGLLGADVEEVA